MQRIAEQILDGRRGTRKRDVGAVAERTEGVGQRRVEFFRDSAESVHLGVGDRLDGRLQLPKGVHHLVLSSTQKHRSDAVGRGEAVCQSCPAALEWLRGKLEARGALSATRRRVIRCETQVAPGVLDGALAAVAGADHIR